MMGQLTKLYLECIIVKIGQTTNTDRYEKAEKQQRGKCGEKNTATGGTM